MPDARTIALDAIIRMEIAGAFPKDHPALGSGSRLLSDADRNLARELIRGTLVWRGRIDGLLARLLDYPLQTLSPVTRNALRIGAYQILFLQRVPPYAAVSEAVRIVREREHAGVAGIVNAVLRRVTSLADAFHREESPPTAQGLADRWSHPEWMVARWLERLGPDETAALLRANNRIPPVILRHNTMKGPESALLEGLQADGIEVLPHPLQKGFWIVSGGRNLFRSRPFTEGWITPQDVSAGLAVLLLDPRPGDSVLDLCAAPGGKTGFIAERMDDRGHVLAMDRGSRRIRDLESTLKRLGLRCVEARTSDALSEDLAGTYDRVLVDAPCSGLGVLARRPDLRWRRSGSDFRSFFDLQMRLLTRGASAVRDRGVLVYSTCTTEPEENEEVVDAFLKAHPTFVVEPARDILNARPAGLYVQTWAHRHGCDGAFSARFRRMG